MCGYREFLTLTAALLLSVGTAVADDHDGESRKGKNHDAVASMVNAGGERTGMIRVQEGPEGVVLRVSLKGLPPGWKAIHIHEKGTCDDHHGGFTDSGGHLDPLDRQHGLLNDEGPELGDLPNIWVHEDGRVKAEIYAPGVTLNGEGSGLLAGDGTAFVIHEGPDDHRTQPIGGAGSRIACGVVRQP
ncbi:superoxide dismutase family protein [Natronospira bacteriovora]|uniref:Superoxide dismutase [Cu-Zn] n=1 Tax=Natronospira bacteriovora TaxID=3069753 RepID=A0ABU0W7T9_9GAMM|nr:superoxide dismutase family protein [Natronospira sp. AB-CW4]MDQ2070066.1 superoxide dismutase family protein [Natronospira sp. AB-CW4]